MEETSGVIEDQKKQERIVNEMFVNMQDQATIAVCESLIKYLETIKSAAKEKTVEFENDLKLKAEQNAA